MWREYDIRNRQFRYLVLGTGADNGPQIDKLEISPASVLRERYTMREPDRGTHGDRGLFWVKTRNPEKKPSFTIKMNCDKIVHQWGVWPALNKMAVLHGRI